ncbi:hypothetical protein [Tsukamurella soli]|uniref:hypothetical protein n=1 Tax=Tsukamurella soli TaxID=644556 RepID=UPI00361DA82D
MDALLAEGDPWFQLVILSKQKPEVVAAKKTHSLALPGMADLVLDGTTDIAATSAFVGDPRMYPHLAALQPDLYRCFMELTWRHRSRTGIATLIHPESHFTDEKATALRHATYRRLRRHWQFENALLLYEIDNHVTYGVHTYAGERPPRFLNASSLYHPDTVTRSLVYNAQGPEPGLKDREGNWDQSPHSSRVVIVDETVLQSWTDILEEPGTKPDRTRMVYAVNSSVSNVLVALSAAPRLGSLQLEFSAGWHEKSDRTKGRFDSDWGEPASWDDVILQGPHLFVSSPIIKAPNHTLRSNKDWTATDFETLQSASLPITTYKPTGDREVYDARYTSWDIVGEDNEARLVHARDCFRVAWRNMANNTAERTLVPALIPPGAAHVHPVYSLVNPAGDALELTVICGVMSSIAHDFGIRAAPKSTIPLSSLQRLPWVTDPRIQRMIATRAARLNCVTDAYATLWQDSYDDGVQTDSWAGGFDHRRRRPLGDVGPEWTPDTPLRIAADRRQALVEIDALVALGLGITADELCTVYRTQFPVLYGYDRNKYLYDMNGRLVPQEVQVRWRKKQDDLTEEERTATNQAGNTYTYELPFQFLDREKDMREAYAVFEARLADNGEV